MTRFAALGVGVVVLAVAAAGSGDYELTATWPGGGKTSCEKDIELCAVDRAAIARGWGGSIPPGAATRCDPRPGCFDARSNCIIGYRGPRAEGYCR